MAQAIEISCTYLLGGTGVGSESSASLSQGFPSLQEGGHFPSHGSEKQR